MVLTNTGRKQITKAIGGSSYTVPCQVAWGDSSTTPTEDDTTLGSELIRKSVVDKVVTGTVVQFQSTLTTLDLNGSDILECGLLDESTGGNLFEHDTFATIEKTSGFEVETMFVVNVI